MLFIRKPRIYHRGQVAELRSDNGTNLVGAEKELRREIQKWNLQQINNVMMKQNIVWKFNPPAASYFSGVWERMIRTVRKVIYKYIQKSNLILHRVLEIWPVEV